jgi:D-tyrosyl-tRNA(Tyr) deacylase
MRAVVQRVNHAAVLVDGETVGQIGRGFVVLVGVREGDEEADAEYLAQKIAHLRVFSDEEGKFNLSLLDVGGEALVVSQFTLYADTRKGRRPSFAHAARPEVAEPLIERFVAFLRGEGVPVQTGQFQAMMQVRLENDGPVTILLDSEERHRPRRG